MYTIYFTNFGYGPDRDFSTLEGAIEYAKLKGFEAAILKNSVVIGSWSIIGGYRDLSS